MERKRKITPCSYNVTLGSIPNEVKHFLVIGDSGSSPSRHGDRTGTWGRLLNAVGVPSVTRRSSINISMQVKPSPVRCPIMLHRETRTKASDGLFINQFKSKQVPTIRANFSNVPFSLRRVWYRPVSTSRKTHYRPKRRLIPQFLCVSFSKF